ncbi:MAG: heavy-metal-associated domain-containing protein, partial [Streptosporangiaceae bacterium]
MITQASAALSRLAEHLPGSAGRAQRRRWVGNGRAHIEVRGIHRPENAHVARRVEAELARLDGVDWAEVNAVAGRVIVAFDDGKLDADDLVAVIEGVEQAHDLAGERFPHDRPDHPGDIEPIQRQMYAIGADIGGLGLGFAGRLVRSNPVVGEVASLVSLVDATPSFRRALESRIGRAATDLGLAVGNAVAQGLAQGPLGLVVDAAHRGLVLGELRARRDLWERREPELHGRSEGPGSQADPPGDGPRIAVRPGGAPAGGASAGGAPAGGHAPDLSQTAERPVPLPPGPVESYTNKAAIAALAGAAAAAAVTRDPAMLVAATVTANPKPARLGREGFAAWLGRDLARSGVLTMDTEALRRLDRIDTVVLDAAVLTTGSQAVRSVWVAPGCQETPETAQLAAHALLSRAD